MNTLFKKVLMSVMLTLTAPFLFAATWHVDCSPTPVQPADFTDLHVALAGGTAPAKPVVAGDTLAISGTCLATAGVAGTFVINMPLTLQQDTKVDASTAILDGGNTLQVVSVTANASTATTGTVLKGITIQNGRNPSGGGILNRAVAGPGLTIDNSTVQNNIASAGDGGGLMNFGTVVISQSSFLGNEAFGYDTYDNDGDPDFRISYGGGIRSNASSGNSVTVSQSLFSGNVADFGSAYADTDESSIIKQSTFSGNFGRRDGAWSVLINSFATTISQSTIAGNSLGVFVYGRATITQSIIANSVSGRDLESLDNNAVVIQDVLTGSVNLDSLKDNGGPTKTMKPLATGSGQNAIGMIPFANCSTATTDQRGAPRPGVGNKPGCDIGAYETGNARLSLALPTGGTNAILNFGSVTGATTMPVIVQNTGNDELTFSSAGTPAGTPVSSNSKFTVSTVLAGSLFPKMLPTQFQNFNVTFTPTDSSTATGGLTIAGSDTSSGTTVSVLLPMTGAGVATGSTPIQEIAAIQAYITQYSKTKPAQLVGENRIALIAVIELKAFQALITLAGNEINKGRIPVACEALKGAALTSDGLAKPLPDIIKGTAVPSLNTMITKLRKSLQCKP